MFSGIRYGIISKLRWWFEHILEQNAPPPPTKYYVIYGYDDYV